MCVCAWDWYYYNSTFVVYYYYYYYEIVILLYICALRTTIRDMLCRVLMHVPNESGWFCVWVSVCVCMCKCSPLSVDIKRAHAFGIAEMRTHYTKHGVQTGRALFKNVLVLVCVSVYISAWEVIICLYIVRICNSSTRLNACLFSR